MLFIYFISFLLETKTQVPLKLRHKTLCIANRQDKSIGVNLFLPKNNGKNILEMFIYDCHLKMVRF